MKLNRFEIYQDDHGEYRWRFVARNGKIMADSGESYHDRSGAKRAIRRFIELVTKG